MRLLSRSRARVPATGPRPRRAGDDGFTLIELVVSLFVLVVVLVGVLLLFDMSRKIARNQTELADMQQSLRIGQYYLVRNMRMAGRGGLPAVLQPFPAPPAAPTYPGKLLPAGLTVGIDDNVGSNVKIAGCTCAKVLAGTDIVTMRGIFNSPLYQINPAGADFTLNNTPPTDGTLTIREISPSGVPQDLQPLADAVDTTKAGNPEALLLVSPLDDAIFAVVELESTSGYTTSAGGKVTQVDLHFRISGGTHTPDYLKISPDGGFPGAMTTVAYAGLLEEYRFYVREEHAIPADATSELAPRLAQARVYPGTNLAYKGDTSNLAVDIADNVFDLQAALGVDTDNDGAILEGDTDTARKTDEWLFNVPGDDSANAAKWNGTAANPTRLYYVRINTVVRTDRRDNTYQAPLLTLVEDNDYSQAPSNKFNTRTERMFRRTRLQTVVDLRNVS